MFYLPNVRKKVVYATKLNHFGIWELGDFGISIEADTKSNFKISQFQNSKIHCYLRTTMIYPLIRELLFCFPPEDVHYFSMNLLKIGSVLGLIKSLLRQSFSINNPSLEKEVFGLHFQNPVGLGAGF